jgi:hypothetical protein
MADDDDTNQGGAPPAGGQTPFFGAADQADTGPQQAPDQPWGGGLAVNPQDYANPPARGGGGIPSDADFNNPNAANPRFGLGTDVNPRPTRGVLQDYISRNGAMNENDYRSEQKRIDPNGTMDPGLVFLQMMKDQTDPDKKVSVLMHGADKYDSLRAIARKDAEAGDFTSAAGRMNEATKYAPHAFGTTFTATSDGVLVNIPEENQRYGDPVKLSNAQFSNFVHGDDSYYDTIQKGNLRDLVDGHSKLTDEHLKGSPVGPQGPGSTTPPPREEGPTREQLVGPQRDLNVPAPETPGTPRATRVWTAPQKGQIDINGNRYELAPKTTPQQYASGMSPSDRQKFLSQSPQDQQAYIDQATRVAYPVQTPQGPARSLGTPEFIRRNAEAAAATPSRAEQQRYDRQQAFERAAQGNVSPAQAVPAIPAPAPQPANANAPPGWTQQDYQAAAAPAAPAAQAAAAERAAPGQGAMPGQANQYGVVRATPFGGEDRRAAYTPADAAANAAFVARHPLDLTETPTRGRGVPGAQGDIERRGQQHAVYTALNQKARAGEELAPEEQAYLRNYERQAGVAGQPPQGIMDRMMKGGEGMTFTLKNGQQWTIQNGKPVRVQ